jgi:hypothetical protein
MEKMNPENKKGEENSNGISGWILVILGGLFTLSGLCLMVVFSSKTPSDISQYLFSALLLTIGVLISFIGIRLITLKDKKTTSIISIGGAIVVLALAGIFCVEVLNYIPEGSPPQNAVITTVSIQQAAYTPLPTYTEYRTDTSLPSITLLPTTPPGRTDMPKPTSIPTSTDTPIPTSIHTLSSTPTSTPSTSSIPILLNSLIDFENSQFCTVYSCQASDIWELKSGGINHSYDINAIPMVFVEVTTINNKPVNFGLIFIDRDILDAEDYQLLFLFLKSIHPGTTIDNTLAHYIQENVEKDLFQICEANPTQFGLLKIWVGSIFQQTIHVGEDCQ